MYFYCLASHLTAYGAVVHAWVFSSARRVCLAKEREMAARSFLLRVVDAPYSALETEATLADPGSSRKGEIKIASSNQNSPQSHSSPWPTPNCSGHQRRPPCPLIKGFHSR